MNRLDFTGIVDRCPAKHLLKFRSCNKANCPFAEYKNPRLERGCDDACASSSFLFNLDHLPLKMPREEFRYYPYSLNGKEINNLATLSAHFNLWVDVSKGKAYNENAICVTITKAIER